MLVCYAVWFDSTGVAKVVMPLSSGSECSK